MNTRWNFALAILSGILLGLAHPGWPIELGFLIWVALIPLLLAIFSYNNRIDLKQVLINKFLLGFSAGFVYFLIFFRWLRFLYPLEAFGINNKLISFLIILFVYLVSSAGMALTWGIFPALLNILRPVNKKGQLIFGALFFASIFTLLEYLRSIFFGILWYGQSTILGPHWTLGNLAYALSNNNLALKFSSYAGIYGLTLIIALVNFAIFSWLKNGQNILRKISVIIIAISLSYVTWDFKTANQTAGKTINYAIIQTDTLSTTRQDSEAEQRDFEKQLELLDALSSDEPEPDIVVFPETSNFLTDLPIFLGPEKAGGYFKNLFNEPQLVLVGSEIIEKNNRAKSRVSAIDTQDGVIDSYDKRLLTPNGEFLPYLLKIPLGLFLDQKTVDLNAYQEFMPGPNKEPVINFKDKFKISVLVCSEIFSPPLAAEGARTSEIIASLTSNSIFKGSRAFARIALAANRFRAAENQKPMLVASNMAPSYAIDNNGKIEKIAENSTWQVLRGSIAPNQTRSLYNRLGDWPILFICLIILIFGAVYKFKTPL